MSNIQLTKRCSNHTFAHLYEHIYFIELDTLLRTKGYFDTVDYSIDAFTENGEITFNIELFTEININDIIHEASACFLSNMDYLDIALAQLECEAGKVVSLRDRDELLQQLMQLNIYGWNEPTIYQVSDEILSTGESIQTNELRVTFGYNGIEAWLRPLYRQVAGLTLNVLLSDIADTYGGFVASETYATDQHHNLIGTIRLHANPDQSELKNMLNNTIAELRDRGGYERLRATLANIGNLETPPSAERTLRDTGVKMTEEAWRELSTPANLTVAIDNIHAAIDYAE